MEHGRKLCDQKGLEELKVALLKAIWENSAETMGLQGYLMC